MKKLEEMNAIELKSLWREKRDAMLDARDAGNKQEAAALEPEVASLYSLLRQKQEQEFWSRQQRDTSKGF